MTLKTISLSFSLLLLTACSSQKINKENIESNLTKKVDTRSKIKNNIISTPILTNNTILAPVTTSTRSIIHTTPISPPIEEYNEPIMEEPMVMVNSSIIDDNSIDSFTMEEEEVELEAPTQNVIYGISGDFAGNYKLEEFIRRMVLEHGFNESSLNQLFSEARNTKMMPTVTYERRRGRTTNNARTGKWDRYRNMFIYERNIQRGLAFWRKHKEALNRAYKTYGVLPEYIMGIIGIETAYGVNFGKKRVIDVLTTKAMTGDRREDFYTDQLEKFLIMTRKANLQPSELMGSSAGAMGYGQFIPSSYLHFAVDFNNDGVTDLWNAEDAIGSIANYFSRNGWNRSLKTVAVRAKYRGNRFNKLETGYKTKYSPYRLRKRLHIVPRQRLHYNGLVSLIKLPRYTHDELWMGTHNFRVITTYNHSDFYGMAVYQLAQAVRKRRYGH